MSKRGRIQNIVIDRSYFEQGNVKNIVIDFGISDEKSAAPFTLELSLEPDALYLSLFNEERGVRFRAGASESELAQMIDTLSSLYAASLID